MSLIRTTSDMPDEPAPQEYFSSFEEEYRYQQSFCEDILYSGDFDAISQMFSWLIKPVVLLHMLHPEEYEQNEDESDTPIPNYTNRRQQILQNLVRFFDSESRAYKELSKN